MGLKQTKICFPDIVSTAVRWLIKTLKLGNKVMIGHQKTNLKETTIMALDTVWELFCTSNTR